MVLTVIWWFHAKLVGTVRTTWQLIDLQLMVCWFKHSQNPPLPILPSHLRSDPDCSTVCFSPTSDKLLMPHGSERTTSKWMWSQHVGSEGRGYDDMFMYKIPFILFRYQCQIDAFLHLLLPPPFSSSTSSSSLHFVVFACQQSYPTECQITRRFRHTTSSGHRLSRNSV